MLQLLNYYQLESVNPVGLILYVRRPSLSDGRISIVDVNVILSLVVVLTLASSKLQIS